MSDQTHTTKFVWDVDSVKRGAAEIDRDYAQLIESEKRLARYRKLNKGSDKIPGGLKNAVQGVKDIAEGRVMFGISRLATTFKSLAVPLGAVAPFALAATRALKIMRSEMEKTDKQAKALEVTFNQNSREATFSNAGQGFRALSGVRGGLSTQLEADRAQQRDIATTMAMRPGGDDSRITSGNPVSSFSEVMAMIAANPIGRAYNKMRRSDLATDIFGEQRSDKDKMTEAVLRDRGGAKLLSKNYQMGTQSLADEAERARRSAPTGESNPFDVSRMDIKLAKERELIELHKEGRKDDERSMKLYEMKYGYLEKSVDAEEAISRARYKGASAELGIQAGGGSEFSKSLQGASHRVALSRAMVASGGLNSEQKQAENLIIQRGENEQRATMAGRYINTETGRRRGNAAIQSDFRNERNATRRRNQFNRRYDAGGFNEVTGRRVNPGDGGGMSALGHTMLSSGGLGNYGGLKSGGLAGVFPAKPKAAVGTEAKTGEQVFLEKIFELMDARLPKETH